MDDLPTPTPLPDHEPATGDPAMDESVIPEKAMAAAAAEAAIAAAGPMEVSEDPIISEEKQQQQEEEPAKRKAGRPAGSRDKQPRKSRRAGDRSNLESGDFEVT